MTKSAAMASEVTETSPLLTPPGELDNTYDQQPTRSRWQSPQFVTWLILIVVLLASFADRLSESPLQRIYESVICYRYYEEHDPSKLLLSRDQVGAGAIGGVPESLCKVDTVQNELAALDGWQQMFDGIPSLLLAIPFGWVADKYGRKYILLGTLVAYCLRFVWLAVVTWFWQAFDVRMVWLSTIPFVFCGGPMILSTMVYVSLSDITPEAKQAAVFLRLAAFNLLAGLLMPPIASWLMERDPWIPVFISIALVFASTILYLFSPETLNTRDEAPVQVIVEQEVELPSDNYIAVQQHTWYTFIYSQTTALKNATSFLIHDWRIPALTPTFLSQALIGICHQLLLQYLSKRYSLSFAKATLVSTIRSAVIVILLFGLLPLASSLLMRTLHVSGQRKDFYLARVSQVLLAAGWIWVGLSPDIPTVAIGLIIASLGQGASTFIRAFMISLTPADRVALVFSIVTIIETLGVMSGGPLMAYLFKYGTTLGMAWIGLPFTFMGLISLVFAVLLWLPIWIRKEDEGLSEDAREDISD